MQNTLFYTQNIYTGTKDQNEMPQNTVIILLKLGKYVLKYMKLGK